MTLVGLPTDPLRRKYRDAMLSESLRADTKPEDKTDRKEERQKLESMDEGAEGVGKTVESSWEAKLISKTVFRLTNEPTRVLTTGEVTPREQNELR